jgi:hypothetical protein
MYNGLIDIDKDGDVFLQDNSIALLPCLWKVYKTRGLGSDMVKWIVSVYDYKSPYRRLPEDERMIRVTYSVYGKESTSKSKRQEVLDAIEEYVKIQYDPLIDQFNAMSEQMFKMNNVYRNIIPTEDNIEDLNKLQFEMGKAAKSREQIKELIIKDQETEAKIAGTTSEDFSMFEQEDRLR